jgi:hypothetical protein
MIYGRSCIAHELFGFDIKPSLGFTRRLNHIYEPIYESSYVISLTGLANTMMLLWVTL